MNNGMFGLPPGLPPVSGLGLGQGVGPTFMYQKVKAYCKPGTYAAERVPDRVKTALAMVFGGGGDGYASSSSSAYSGAGGGFAMAEFPVTPGELLPPIIVGDRAGTSSFGQFLSATGGSHATSSAHGTGGVGAVMAGLKNALAYPGGSPTGGIGSLIQGGGSSGSPYGPGVGPASNQGGGGGWGTAPTDGNTLGGNGKYKNVASGGYGTGGAGSQASNFGSYGEHGGYGFDSQTNWGFVFNSGFSTPPAVGDFGGRQSTFHDLLMIPYLESIGGAGGAGIQYQANVSNTPYPMLTAGDGGPWAGGGGIYVDTATSYTFNLRAGNGGIGGGGGGIWNSSGILCNVAIGGKGGFGGGGGGVNPANSSGTYNIQIGGDGGIAGGGGGCAYIQTNSVSRAGRGGVGTVLVFYLEGN